MQNLVSKKPLPYAMSEIKAKLLNIYIFIKYLLKHHFHIVLQYACHALNCETELRILRFAYEFHLYRDRSAAFHY